MSFKRRKALPTSIAIQSGCKKLQDVALKTRTERLRFSKLRNSIPTTGTETWMDEDPEVTVEEQETSRDPEKIGGLMEEFMSCYAENGKSADPAFERIAGTALNRLSFNLQAALEMFLPEDALRDERDSLKNSVSAFGLARPVSSKGVLGPDSVKIILEHVLKKNGEESTGGQKETALLINVDMYSGRRVAVSHPARYMIRTCYVGSCDDFGTQTLRKWWILKASGPSATTRGFRREGSGQSTAPYQGGVQPGEYDLRVELVLPRASPEYWCSHGPGGGDAAVVARPASLQRQSRRCYRGPQAARASVRQTRPSGSEPRSVWPLYLKGAAEQAEGPAVKGTGMIHGKSKEKLSLYSAATEMLAGHSQRSHTLMTNYIRVDNRISLTAGTTDEGPPVVPQTAAANQLVAPVGLLSKKELRVRDPELGIYEEMARLLRSSLAAGSEYWKLTAGFRNLPGIGAMTAVDGAGLLSRLQKIIRNKVQKLRRQEEGQPGRVELAAAAHNSLEIDKLISDLDAISADDGKTTDGVAGLSEEATEDI
ncbi:hypothetical protein A1Q2_01829 [Trichosporon asahii var. asahii CBS 8904]|uniref:Uncharacterized protein n=1 Tax=Trichosporon asahii var. asahii (strain CBS 8904) TaxID=1220162 RepID=K1VTC9_TRIAC|nr:hypothetical protein A1Q2_01829 [Trichosporon asahii var. asahii CBS 8904]